MKDMWKAPRFWVGIVVSVVCVGIVARQVDWTDVVASLHSADWRMVLLGSSLLVVAWGLFAVRGQLLLEASASVPWKDVFSYLLIGYWGNTVLPLRLGDVSRLALMRRKFGVRTGYMSAVVLIEKLLDVLTIVSFAAILMLVVPVPDLVRRGVQGMAIASLVLTVALVVMASVSKGIGRAIDALAERLPHRHVDRVVGLARTFAQGLRSSVRSPGQAVGILTLSVVAWMISAMSIMCYVYAFRLAVPWYAAVLVMVVTNLGGAIPSSPGAIGVYEFLAALALSTWIEDERATFSFAIVTHALVLLMTVVFGMAAAWRESVSFHSLAEQATVSDGDEEPAPPALAASRDV